MYSTYRKGVYYNRYMYIMSQYTSCTHFIIVILIKLWYISILYSLHKSIIEYNYNGYMYTDLGKYLHTQRN